MRRALAFGLADPDTIVVALAGFLLRGGIVLLLLPSAVLPSVIGIAGATGVDAFGIDGRPTPWLFEVAVVASVAVALWLLLAFTVGSLVDVWLIEAVRDEDADAARRPRPLPDLGILLDLAGIRAICLVPVAAAVVWAGSQIYNSVYNELTVPSNLAVPLPIRVIEGAGGAVLVVGLAWLASEVVAAIAVRRLVVLDAGVPRALGGAIVQIVRRPLSTALTAILSFGTSLMAMGLVMIATTTAFDWCRVATRAEQPILVTIGIGSLGTTRDFRPAVFVLAVFALGLAWVAALAVSGVASAWRSAAFTGETEAAISEARTASMEPTLGLSGSTTERSGD